jgi:hypothetical protein
VVPRAKKANDCISPANISGRPDRMQSILAFNMGHNICNSATTFFEILLTKLNNIRVNVVYSRSRLYWRCHRIGRGGVAGCKTDIGPHLIRLITVSGSRNIYYYVEKFYILG